ncbi:MAG: RidA family protein [Synergistetes bacterium]|nr:RidA family protein [Synergistota bacterium]
MKKEFIRTEKAPLPLGPYSQAVSINGTVYISAQVPIDPKTGNLVNGGIMEQTHQVLKNVSNILEAAGMSLSDVVKVNMFLKDMDNFGKMNEVYKEYFEEGKYPARAIIPVKELPLGAELGIECIAIAEKS